MKKIWISLFVALLLMILGFIWCLPFSNSYELMSNIIIDMIKSSILTYLVYFIFRFLDKLNVLSMLYRKTDEAIKYIPYIIIFYCALNAFIAVFMIFGVKMFVFSSRLVPFVACLHVNRLIQNIFKKYDMI